MPLLIAVVQGGGGTRPARHRTLRTMIEWSYDLLEDSEQALFDRLSVFEGDFSVAAAEGALAKTDGRVKDAVLVARGCSAAEARDRLAAGGGDLRGAMNDLDSEH